MFKKYMHIERFGNDEVEGIEFGNCYIFCKIDETEYCIKDEIVIKLLSKAKKVHENGTGYEFDAYFKSNFRKDYWMARLKGKTPIFSFIIALCKKFSGEK